MIRIILCITSIAVLLVGNEPIESKEKSKLSSQHNSSSYPYSIAKKSDIELKNVEQKFKNENGKICRVRINPYTGLINGVSNLNFIESPTRPSKEMVKKLVLEFLNKNKIFFGFSMFSIEDNPLGWRYPDVIADMLIKPEIEYKDLYIIPTGEGNLINENFKNRVIVSYRADSNAFTEKPHLEIYIYEVNYYLNMECPANPMISQEKAISSLDGYEYSFSGEGGTIKSKFERGKDFFKISRLAILPWINTEGNKLEFRLVWQIEQASSMSDLKAGVSMWTIYIDAVTGIILYLRQNFET